jgi:flagellin
VAQGTGVYTTRATQTTPVSNGSGYQFLTGDFNGDGLPDAIAISAQGNGADTITITAYSIIGGSFSTSTLQGVESSGNDGKVATMQISLGGDTDNSAVRVLLKDGSANQVGGAFELDGAGQLSKYTSGLTGLEADNGKAALTEDFDGDGVIDSAVAVTGGGVSTFTVSTQNTTMVTTYESVAQTGLTLGSVLTARAAITYLATLSDTLARARSSTGTSLRRLSAALSVLDSARQNYGAAESRIRDADVASEAAGLTKLNILRQTETSILAQANQQSALALQLLRF